MMVEMLDNPYPLSDINYYKQWLVSHFFKLNDSINMNAERLMNQYQKVIANQINNKIVKDSIHELTAKDDQNEQKFAYCDLDSTIKKLWAMKYNPIGKMLSCLNMGVDKYFDQSEKITRLQQKSIRLSTESTHSLR
ncbi:hypothetical protein [Shewanella sp. OMA3-2]|uniref:hypothetical protein n=1 Tax=Shewanella sp. OMA3-2 TaxID=2908650 RepID=UPI001F15BB75|nr:hypothetical protein [Shewanella sp. OMA3-2]UJF21422.1 hypothetical protein L0B17_15245 [Shewanella sp. OMA3-2]